MPFQRPLLTELNERAIADIEARLSGVDARLRRSFLNVLARTHSGAVHGLYGYLEFISRQVFPDTAEAEFMERWASIWGIVRRAAAPAVGNVTFTGTNGSVIPAGTALLRSDAAEFTTDVDGTIASGSVTVAVTAVVASADGNTDAGSLLSLASPIAGVNASATVAAGGLVDGIDAEADEQLLDRLLARIKLPPQGGSKADYERWMKEVAGVTRAWVYPGPGLIDVTFVMDGQAGTIIPSPSKVAEVLAYLYDATRRPVTAEINVFAPTAYPVNFTIALSPNNAAVRSAVQGELFDLFKRDAEPRRIPGTTGVLLRSRIDEAISVAAGETSHVLTLPAGDVTPHDGGIATLGSFTWQ